MSNQSSSNAIIDEEDKIDYDEKSIIEGAQVNNIFVGFIHEEISNMVHLITQKDIEKYKLHSKNPITKALENGWSIKKRKGQLCFTKEHEGKMEVFDEK